MKWRNKQMPFCPRCGRRLVKAPETNSRQLWCEKCMEYHGIPPPVVNFVRKDDGK